MINTHQSAWMLKRDGFPPIGVPVWALIENDVLDPADEWHDPWAAKLVLEQGATIKLWRMLEFDQQTQEEYLQQCYTVIAWRPLAPEEEVKRPSPSLQNLFEPSSEDRS